MELEGFPGRGHIALGSSDQFPEARVERWAWARVWGPIGSAKHTLSWWPGDVPVVFMEESVMKSTEENQVVEIGRPTLGPGDDVMDLQPPGVGTPGPLAASIVTMVHLAT